MTHPSHPTRLHRHPLSGHAHRAQLMLSLLNVPTELVDVNLAAAEHKSPAFLARNAFGQLPVLEIDGTVLADSNAILVYLASTRDPQRQWWPEDARTQAEVQRWLSVSAGQLAHGPAAARLVNVFKRPPNPAAVATAEGQRANAEAATLWRGVGAILVEVVDDPDPILVGNQTTYTVRITNQGSADLVNINTSAVFPAQIAPVATQHGVVQGPNVKFQTVPRLAPKAVVEFKLTAKGVSVGDARVKFSFTEDSLTSPVIEEESTRVF